MAMLLRALRADEIETLALMLLEAYDQYFPQDPTPAERAPWQDYRDDIADVASRFERSEQIIAERDGRIVGGVTFYPPGLLELENDLDQPTPAMWAGIRLLGVDPQARGGGIGRALTEETIARARDRGATHLALHTTERMTVAREMYERMGFVRIPDYDFKPIPGSEFTVMAYLLEL